jgi:hypothetical protein
VALLRRVVRGGWPARFAQVEIVAGMVYRHRSDRVRLLTSN